MLHLSSTLCLNIHGQPCQVNNRDAFQDVWILDYSKSYLQNKTKQFDDHSCLLNTNNGDFETMWNLDYSQVHVNVQIH
jgi:hypothetical protein